jgi:hypothetical protein
MPRQQALSQWIDTVSTHLPHLSRPQATVLALWSYGMVLVRSCGISSVSAMLAALLHKKEGSVRQQLREWCYDAQHKKGEQRQSLDVTSCFAPLLQWIIQWCQWWPEGERRVALAMDATTLGQRFVVLTISVVYRGCAIPVAWRVVGATRKGAWKPHWLALFTLLQEGVPTEWMVIVLADRGLYARWLYRHIVSIGWHPYLRINRGAKFCLPQYRRVKANFHYLDTLLPAPGADWCGQVVCFSDKGGRLKCTLLAWRGQGYDEAWFVLTDLPPEVADIAWYGMRAWIECGFKDLKRGGWSWHQTKMTDPARACRLWLAVAVATMWVVSVGGEVDSQLAASSLEGLEGLPLLHVARQKCKRGPTQRGRARMISCFQRGVITIIVALLEGNALPMGRFVPQAWPTRPDCASPDCGVVHFQPSSSCVAA